MLVFWLIGASRSRRFAGIRGLPALPPPASLFPSLPPAKTQDFGRLGRDEGPSCAFCSLYLRMLFSCVHFPDLIGNPDFSTQRTPSPERAHGGRLAALCSRFGPLCALCSILFFICLRRSRARPLCGHSQRWVPCRQRRGLDIAAVLRWTRGVIEHLAILAPVLGELVRRYARWCRP
jgi:hypothetical protein